MMMIDDDDDDDDDDADDNDDDDDNDCVFIYESWMSAISFCIWQCYKLNWWWLMIMIDDDDDDDDDDADDNLALYSSAWTCFPLANPRSFSSSFLPKKKMKIVQNQPKLRSRKGDEESQEMKYWKQRKGKTC